MSEKEPQKVRADQEHAHVSYWMKQLDSPEPSMAWRSEVRAALHQEAQGKASLRVSRRRLWWFASGVTAVASGVMLFVWFTAASDNSNSWGTGLEEALLEAHRESVLFEDAGLAPVLDEHFLERWTRGT